MLQSMLPLQLFIDAPRPLVLTRTPKDMVKNEGRLAYHRGISHLDNPYFGF